jgi:HPr kinase/phosphorylase
VTIHATAVAFNQVAVLIRGPSGAGKSDLALRLLALPWSALAAFGVPDLGDMSLIADDRVELKREGHSVLAAAPAALAGLLEVRGLGIIDAVRTTEQCVVALVVDLVAANVVERMPPDGLTTDLLGVAVPQLKMAAFEASAPLKIALALARRPMSSGTPPTG